MIATLLAGTASIGAAAAGTAQASTTAYSHVSSPATQSSPAVAVPLTASGCVNTRALDPPEVCMTIDGQGLYINYVHFSVNGGYAIGKFKFTGPSGTWYGPLINVENGASESLSFNTFVKAGNYWGYFEDEVSSGKYKQTAGVYITVHA
jgi:hypothetical protein